MIIYSYLGGAMPGRAQKDVQCKPKKSRKAYFCAQKKKGVEKKKVLGEACL